MRKLDHTDIDNIHLLSMEGYSTAQIARELNIARTVVRNVIQGKSYVELYPPLYEPTPEEIRDACRQIQQEWPADVEKNRRCTQSSDFEWMPPEVAGIPPTQWKGGE